ncbi:D-2-hydroxyacid dehydrogenase [Neobacillus sp. K501]
MKINNILFVSPMYNEIKEIIEKENLQKNLRYLSEEELTQNDLDWADALAAFNLKSNFEYETMKWVHSLGAGVDRFLYKKEWNEDVLLTRTICSFGQRIAEYCLSYILKDMQYHDEFQNLKQQKSWSPMTPKLLNQHKVMIYGTGEIGQMTAKVLSGLGMEVFGVSLSGQEKEFFKKVYSIDSHASRLESMDFIINTLPLTEQTVHLLDENIFNQLSNAGFINVGRGLTIDDKALLQALEQNKVRFAVLDVFSQEPLPPEHPFWNHPCIHITPHISAVTTPNEGVACFLDTLKKIEENIPLNNKVNAYKGY